MRIRGRVLDCPSELPVCDDDYYIGGPTHVLQDSWSWTTYANHHHIQLTLENMCLTLVVSKRAVSVLSTII